MNRDEAIMDVVTIPGKRSVALEEKIKKLNAIGIALSSEHTLGRLLELMVKEARNFSNADAASLYIRENEQLKFVVSQTASLDDHNGTRAFHSYYLPMTKESIAGYVAVTGELLNIRDVYGIPESVAYRFNNQFDLETGYRSKSMLVVPLRDHTEEVIGVLQLINSLNDSGEIVVFDSDDENIILSLASQAAVAIRNAKLIEDIKRLFRSLVRYSAKAIDARSPQTAGHSGRVAKLSVRIAQAIEEETEGRLGAIRFTGSEIEELRMAGWLHDIGKIGVPESVLEKSNKLSDDHLALIAERFDSIRSSIRAHYLERKLQLQSRDVRVADELKQLHSKMLEELDCADEDLKFLERLNVPGRLTEDDIRKLHCIAEKSYLNGRGERCFYLTRNEFGNLSIEEGSLNDAEYKQMQSHVEHTISILNKIPFTKDLEDIPKHAGAHHEYLDGSGYPRGLKGDAISLQARIMCIADIFDAMRSPDRPYKEPVSLEQALNVLRQEANAGRIDKDIVNLFIRRKLYQRRIGEDDED